MRPDAFEPEPPRGTVQAWTNLLRTPLPHLHPEAFRALHPVRVDQADTATLLRIQPSQEVKRALAPWTRRFGTTVPLFTSLDAEADELSPRRMRRRAGCRGGRTCAARCRCWTTC